MSRNDHPMPLGGGTVDSWSRALTLTRDELLAAYEATWPDRDGPADHEIAGIHVEVDVAEVPPEAMTEVDDGRFRLSWPDTGRYVCLGNEHLGVVTTAGCVLVEAEAPAAITIQRSSAASASASRVRRTPVRSPRRAGRCARPARCWRSGGRRR